MSEPTERLWQNGGQFDLILHQKARKQFNNNGALWMIRRYESEHEYDRSIENIWNGDDEGKTQSKLNEMIRIICIDQIPKNIPNELIGIIITYSKVETKE